ncbi:thermonuclease family protein [bacterium]|nr:thermonuclease family protein [bacterium]
MSGKSSAFLFLLLLTLSTFTLSHLLLREIAHRQNPQKAAQEEGEFLVVDVIDGNTIELETGERVKYIGVDAPQISKDKVECFAREALWENRRLVLNKIVNLEKDAINKDSEGNLLRYVWIYGKMVNLELIRNGYAKIYPDYLNKKYQHTFQEAEKYAQENKLGLWRHCLSNFQP